MGQSFTQLFEAFFAETWSVSDIFGQKIEIFKMCLPARAAVLGDTSHQFTFYFSKPPCTPANPSAVPAKATPKPATATTDQASAPGHLPSNAASNRT